MHVLPLDVHETPSEVAQQVRGHRSLVDECARAAARTEDAAHETLSRTILELVFGEPLPGRVVGTRLEHAAHLGPVGPGTDHVGVRTGAQQQSQCVDEYGLPGSGLAGERGHAPFAVELEVIDDRKVPNRQVRKHD